MTLLTHLYIIATYTLLIGVCAAGILVPFIIHLNPAPGPRSPRSIQAPNPDTRAPIVP